MRRSFVGAALIKLGWPWWALPDSTEKRLAYLRSGTWARRKRRVWRRARGICEWSRWDDACDRPGRDVHHLTYSRLYNERLGDLVLLCGLHHALAHGRCGSVERPPARIWKEARYLWRLRRGRPGLLRRRQPLGVAFAVVRWMRGRRLHRVL